MENLPKTAQAWYTQNNPNTYKTNPELNGRESFEFFSEVCSKLFSLQEIDQLQ